MAYAALISLKYTLRSLCHPGYFSIPDSKSIIISSTLEEIETLQQVLEILDERNRDGRRTIKAWDLVESQMSNHFPSEYQFVQLMFNDNESLDELLRRMMDASDGRIREAVSKLVEVLHQCLLLSPNLLLVELERVKQEISSFKQTVKMINDREKVKKEDNQNKSSDTVRLCDEFSKTKDLIRGIRKNAEEVLRNLKTDVKRFDKGRSNSSRERVDALEVQIREAVCEFEDLLDTSLSNLLNSQSERLTDNLEQVLKGYSRSACHVSSGGYFRLFAPSSPLSKQHGSAQISSFHFQFQNRWSGVKLQSSLWGLPNAVVVILSCLGHHGLTSIPGEDIYHVQDLGNLEGASFSNGLRAPFAQELVKLSPDY